MPIKLQTQKSEKDVKTKTGNSKVKVLKVDKIAEYRKASASFICKNRPNDTVITLEDGSKAIINKDKLENLFSEAKEDIQTIGDFGDVLQNPEIFNLITIKEFDKKIVGEIEARQTIFLVENMKNVENLNKATDNLMVNAPSGTGKDYITEAVFDIIPVSRKEELIRTTPKVLAYTRNKAINPKATWKGVSLRLEDVGNDVLNDDSFKVMASASPNKINHSKIVNRGKIIEIEIEGKPPIIMTTANPNPKEEQLRRFPICQLDEGLNQTNEILKRQAEYAQLGKTIEYDGRVTQALRYLRRIRVKIPYAQKLIKIFCPENVIVRTHFTRFLDYIRSSCALHQYQREKDEEGFYIATGQDYDIARIALIKTTSNILMIPLTKLQTSILSIFKEKNLQKQSVDDIAAEKGIEKLNLSDKWLRVQLDYLASKTFLVKGKERRYDEAGKIIPKPVFTFSYNQMQRLEVPTFAELTETNTNTTNKENTTISSNTSNSGVIEVNEVNARELNIDKDVKEAKEWEDSNE